MGNGKILWDYRDRFFGTFCWLPESGIIFGVDTCMDEIEIKILGKQMQLKNQKIYYIRK